MDTIRACACGERRTFRCSIPGISTSKVYRAAPVTTCGPAGAARLDPIAAPGAGSSMVRTPSIASAIARYPVHRHRLPLSERGRSVRWRSDSAAVVMIMPAVQNPHWNPCASRKLCCTGCRPSGGARPSIVVTSRPWARNAGYTHECTGLPSTCTVHAPQSPVSQPFLTPKQPRSRR